MFLASLAAICCNNLGRYKTRKGENTQYLNLES